MRILIDIGHPAHVHIFKNFAVEMIASGHQILFTCREKEFEVNLLKHFGFEYKSFGRKYRSLKGKTWGMLKFDIKELMAGLSFKPDIFLSHGSIYAAHAAFLLRKPHISFEDTFNFEQIRLYKPFTDVILTSDYDHPLKSPKVVRYSGFHELAYLHPARFTPDASVLTELGVGENEKYVIFRLVSWHATHDYGHSGLDYDNIVDTIAEFSKYAKVFISSESNLPEKLEQYKLNIAPHKIHDVIAFAALVFGESSTMSEEAAMLGVPSVYLYSNSTIYTTYLEKNYGLIVNLSEEYTDQRKAIDIGSKILQSDEILQECHSKATKMLSEKIDVTAFLLWFVQNYPESKKIMNENSDYQLQFKK